MTEGINRGFDQLRPVVKRNDMHAGGQPRLEFLDFLFYPVDDFFRVLACPSHDYSADRFGAVLDQGSSTECVADLDGAQTLHENSRAAMRTHHDISDIIELFHQAKPAYDGPGTVLGDDITAHIRVARHHGAHHHAERNAVGAQQVRIDINLVLLHRAPDARYFGNSGDRIELIADIPVLQSAQIAHIQPHALHRVPEDVAHPCRVRSERRHNTSRKLFAHQVQAFQHACAGEIKVHIVVEDHEDHGEAERRRGPHHLDAGQPLQADSERVGDLVLYLLRTAALPICEDNHLVIAKVRNRVDV